MDSTQLLIEYRELEQEANRLNKKKQQERELKFPRLKVLKTLDARLSEIANRRREIRACIDKLKANA